MERYTGRSWSKASVSAAERSWRGGRPRRFDMNELVALGVIFDVPLANFLMPPEEPIRAVVMAQPEEIDGASFPLLGVPKLVKLALMDYSKDPLSNEFLPRAFNASQQYLNVEFHPPVFLDPELGLPQMRPKHVPVPVLPPDPEDDTPEGSLSPHDSGDNPSIVEPPPIAVLQHIDEVAGRISPEALRRYIRSEAISAAYEAYKKWEDQGAPDDGPPDESEIPKPPEGLKSTKWGNYPEEPPF